MKRFVSVACGVLAALLMAAGCAAGPKAPTQAQPPTKPTQALQPASPYRERLTKLPDLSGQSLADVASLLDGQGVKVTVRLPAAEVTRSVEATRIAGALKPAYTKTVKVGLRAYPLEALKDSCIARSYKADTQSPRAGSDMKRSKSVTVRAKPDSADSARQWIFAHSSELKSRGLDSCLSCHTPEDCFACHEKNGQ